MLLNTTMETVAMSASYEFLSLNTSISIMTTKSTTVCNMSASNTCNGTVHHQVQSHYLDGITLLTQIVCILIIISGVIGNALVLLVFTSRWAQLSSYEVFMVSLAVSDMLGTIVLPSTHLHEVSNGDFKGIGTIGCKILTFSSASSIYVSSFTLTMISIDRFLAVKWPFKKRKHVCRLMISCTWLLGYGAAFIYLLGDRVMLYTAKGSHRSVCRLFPVSLREVVTITLVTFSLQNAVPLLVMSASSTLIVYELRKHSQSSLMHEAELYRRRNRTRKTMKLLIVVVVVYLICITPINIYQILLIFESYGDLSDEYVVLIHTILSMVMMTNSCINPIIYSRLHTSFRKRTLNMLRKLFFQPYRFASKRITSVYYARNRRKLYRRKRFDRKQKSSTIVSLDETTEVDVVDAEDNQKFLSEYIENTKTVSSLSEEMVDASVSPSNSFQVRKMLDVIQGTRYMELRNNADTSDLDINSDVLQNINVECLETQLDVVKETIL